MDLLDELESRVVCGHGGEWEHYCSIAVCWYRNVKCYAGAGFSSLDSTPFLVENVLGQLTESRGANEDRL
ncbi:MAG: hypothetical protein DME71_13355 [Verrucomicrobia bacterium]|nr:MAG: hypothetical protein DME71_13355 [Verrucomicrobiota bacterium]